MDQCVVAQIARLLQRARTLQQLRTANRKNELIEKTINAQAWILTLAEAHADIDFLMGNVDKAVGHVDAHIGIGVALEKTMQAGHQPFRGEGR
jgi:hypothetical protein